MTTPSCNAPLDIPAPTSVMSCDIRCAYTYNYKESTTNVKKHTEYISMSYETTAVAPVTYNNTGYNVSTVRIYRPSIHTYGSKSADAEMIIIHTPLAGGNPLLVCIPIMQSSVINQATENLDFLTDVLSRSGDTTIPDFYTLNTFVGSKPFYTYTGSMFNACDKTVDYIVFRPSDYSINISQYSFNVLKDLIVENKYQPSNVTNTTTPPPLFYNSKGPNAIVSKDEIYIDCKPVNKSEEEMLLSTPMYVLPKLTYTSVSNQAWFKMIIFFVLFVIMIYIFYYSIQITNSLLQPIIRLSKYNVK